MSDSAMMSAPSGAGPLDGIRVLELGSLVAGPFGGRLLADFGAQVIKVETPAKPDPLRAWGHDQFRGKSLWWAIQSRNKQCITLDLRHPQGREVFLELVALCDVVLENFRPGTLERWGLGYDELTVVNPGVILTRVSGYGQTGPYASRAGFASVAEAMGGLRHINGFPDQPPPRAGISLGDSLGGMYAVMGTLAALVHRERCGEGQVVDVSLMESCFALMEGALPEFDLLGLVREPTGTSLKGVAPSNIFRTADDHWIVIAANNDSLFGRLCVAIGREELIDDARFRTHLARGDNQVELDGVIGAWALQHPWKTIDELLNDVGVACGPIFTIADIVGDEQFQARQMFVEVDDESIGRYRTPGIVPKFSRTPGEVKWSGSDRPGSHNEEIFGGLLKMTEQQRARLRDSGASE